VGLPSAALVEMTGGIGPDACIDAVGMESHGFTADSVMDKVKAAVKLVTDQTHGLRQVIIACRKGGRISIPGVYGGVTDKFPIGALIERTVSEERANACTEVHAAIAETDHGGETGHDFPHQSSRELGAGARRLQDVQGTAECGDQSRSNTRWGNASLIRG
jgi:hypothetical protein